MWFPFLHYNLPLCIVLYCIVLYCIVLYCSALNLKCFRPFLRVKLRMLTRKWISAHSFFLPHKCPLLLFACLIKKLERTIAHLHRQKALAVIRSKKRTNVCFQIHNGIAIVKPNIFMLLMGRPANKCLELRKNSHYVLTLG